jgi:hypothetical protein
VSVFGQPEDVLIDESGDRSRFTQCLS